jgi:hypothetical protein
MVTILQDLRQVTYFNNMASAIGRKAQQKSKDFSIESMSLVRSPDAKTRRLGSPSTKLDFSHRQTRFLGIAVSHLAN